MKRFDGNNILLVDPDVTFSERLGGLLEGLGAIVSRVGKAEEAKEHLLNHEFDLVLGELDQVQALVSWFKGLQDTCPLFVGLGESVPAGFRPLKNNSISAFFVKRELPILIKGIHDVLFNFGDFKESLLEMVEERGIHFEVMSPAGIFHARPMDLTSSGIFLAFEGRARFGTTGSLNVDLYEGKNVEHFIFQGTFTGNIQGGQHFTISDEHARSWRALLSRLEEKQIEILGFLNKAAGD